jgi:hypothetical protein
MRFDGSRHGRRRLAGADYHQAAGGRPGQPVRQAMRRVGRGHRGIEQLAQQGALVQVDHIHSPSQPRESSVRPAGLYSQPTQPS